MRERLGFRKIWLATINYMKWSWLYKLKGGHIHRPCTDTRPQPGSRSWSRGQGQKSNLGGQRHTLSMGVAHSNMATPTDKPIGK